MQYMPYGPGYVYVKSQSNRDEVVQDVKHQTELIISSFQEMVHTLDWMSQDSQKAAKNKSDSLVKNYGWPDALFLDFVNFTKIDSYHEEYYPIVSAYKKKTNLISIQFFYC
ncbi:hypothetical protein KIN20_033686 [Parelaphostrongylus tenuis]|uniref:Peptidase M13 N-terminal domain-containing protein n=1 Tax=Parelaphostrongylus tenuis TaxID=148309 RepID=A0AAD5RAT1_PARTN|nr:hypothetical protein KIN20_033686 [Parelaphostrongylus tenuis]